MNEKIQTTLLVLLALSPLLICLLVWLRWFRKKSESKNKKDKKHNHDHTHDHGRDWKSYTGWIFTVAVLIWTVIQGIQFWKSGQNGIPWFLLGPISLPLLAWLFTNKHEGTALKFYIAFGIPFAIAGLVYRSSVQLEKSRVVVETLASSPIHSSAELEALQIRRGITEIRDWTGWFTPLRPSRWRPCNTKLDWGFETLTFELLSMSRYEFFSVTISNIPGGITAEGKWHWYSSDKTEHIEGKVTLGTLLPQSADKYGPIGGVLHDLPQNGMNGPREDLPFSLVPSDRKEFMRKIMR